MDKKEGIGFGTIFLAVLMAILWTDFIINPPDVDMEPAKKWVGEVVEDNTNDPVCDEQGMCSTADIALANLHLFIPGVIVVALSGWILGPAGKSTRRKLGRRGI